MKIQEGSENPEIRLAVTKALARELENEIRDRRVNCFIRTASNRLCGYIYGTVSDQEIRDLEARFASELEAKP